MKPLSTSPPTGLSQRKRWRWAVAVAALGLVLVWPRRVFIPMANGGTFEIVRVTYGPRHVCPDPLTWDSLWNQLSRGKFHSPGWTDFAPEGSIAIWSGNGRHSADVQLLLVDRHGWRWEADAGFWGAGSRRDLFPRVERESRVTMEVRKEGQWLGSTVLKVPSFAAASSSPLVSQLPIQRTDGPLSLRIMALEVKPLESRPSRGEVRLRVEAEWNGRPYPVRIAEMLVVDALSRVDTLRIKEEGRITTHLSPYVDWNVEVAVWPPTDEPLDEEETFSASPRVGANAPVQQWDKDVAGTGWRVLFSPGFDDVFFPQRFADQVPSPNWEDGHAVIAVEREPGRPGTPRISIESTGPGDKLSGWQKGECLMDTTTSPDQRFWSLLCDPLDPRKRHRITIGFETPRRVQFSVRPKVLEAGVAP